MLGNLVAADLHLMLNRRHCRQLAENEQTIRRATISNRQRKGQHAAYGDTHTHTHTQTHTHRPRKATPDASQSGATCAVLQAPHNTALGAYEAPNQLAGDLKLHQGCSIALPIPQLQQPGSRAERQRLWPQPAAGLSGSFCGRSQQQGIRRQFAPTAASQAGCGARA